MRVIDLDRTTGTLQVEHDQCDKPRSVFVGDKALKEIVRHLRMRDNMPPMDPLFAHKSSGEFARKGTSGSVGMSVAILGGVNARTCGITTAK